jgi:hypothetical protein
VGYDRSGDEPKSGMHFFSLTIQKITQQDDDAETLLAFIPEVFGLNTERDIIGFSWGFSIPLVEFWD